MHISFEAINEIDAIKDRDTKILAAAVMYCESGFFICPIRPNGKALPGKSYNFNYTHVTNKVKKAEAWFGPGGKYEGWNIGIATGRRDGAFVIDLDTHHGVDGLANFNDITPEGWQFTGPIQATPSGGKHLVMGWREFATSSTGKLAEGVDTRGGDEEQCRGHIVAWPSIVDGKQYQWEFQGEVQTAPDWVMQNMGRPLATPKGSGRGNEQVGQSDVEDKFLLTDIVKMLSVINPDELSYSEWLEIGQAVHSQHSGPDGLEVWDDWSAAGERYERNECKLRWEGFNEGGAIRIGTLIHYAKQRGYELSAIPMPDMDHIDELVAQMNERYAVVPMGGDVMIVQEREVVPELSRIDSKFRFLKKQGFRSLLENKFEVGVNAMGKPVKQTHADIWLAHEDRCEYPGGVGLFPNQPKRYHGYLNLWQGFTVEPKKGDWSHFRYHVLEVVCNGDEDLYEWVMDWLADLVQDPGNPKGTAVVMHGIEGCGKGTFAQMVGGLFGTHFKHLTSEEHLVGRFNGHMADAVFVFADEAVFGGDRKVAGKLKSLVTESIITSERKGVDATQYHNCAHLVVASNEQWFIPAGPQSRRWLVLEVSGKHANADRYFNDIHRQMEQEGGMAAMLEYLLGRRITRNLKKAPETEALQEQRQQYTSMDSFNAWWFEQLSREVLAVPSLIAEVDDDNGWPAAVGKNDLWDSYVDWCKNTNRRTVADNRFYKNLVSAGFTQYRPTVGSRRVYAYKTPTLDQGILIAKVELGYQPMEIKDED